MKRPPLYIETHITCSLDSLWKYTQEPAIHQVWDLRFNEIEYLPKSTPEEPQQFRYATKIGLGLKVEGTGESVGTKTKDNGESTSVLEFFSGSPISIIREGSGYWKYVPQAEGIKFFTGYDYKTRWGAAGRIIDKLFFRPLMVWATAWSFDCLKNWIEKGWHPKQALQSLLSILFANIILGLIWIYQGLVPKLFFPDTGELEILKSSGLLSGYEKEVLVLIGLLEIVFGIFLLVRHRKVLHKLNIIILMLLTIGAVFSDPGIFLLPFNPFSLNLAMTGISVIALLNFKYLPKASNCKTIQK